MDSDRVDRAMVASIHQIVRVMGLRTVAEGVENESALLALSEIGVDYAQGYAIARPAPLAKLLEGSSEDPVGPHLKLIRLTSIG
jgi:EAL domain-containing protein (putative c-di-GMP-specific phosphodiesterase class I)